jgi:hypothetical protein
MRSRAPPRTEVHLVVCLLAAADAACADELEVGGPGPPPKISRVIFDKMQGGPTHFIAESHYAAESWKNFSLSKEQGEASGIAGKSEETAGCKEAGCRDHGTNGQRKIAVPRVRSVPTGGRAAAKLPTAGASAGSASRSAPIACDGMAAGISEARFASGFTLRRLQGQNDR